MKKEIENKFQFPFLPYVIIALNRLKKYYTSFKHYLNPTLST